MLQLASKNLENGAQARLTDLQSTVNALSDFTAKANKAKALWEDKTNSNIGKSAFETIKNTLAEMCVSVKICNYCEQNEANDIEHIYPKSLFPEKAFVWDNYLLACKQCNTAYKSDKFAVLDNNDDIIDLPRNTQPPHDRGAFINPRVEDPSAFMLLNIGSYKFEILPNLLKPDNNKAVKTIEILQLNNRDQLVESRRAAAVYFFQRMDLLTKILTATTIAEIKSLLTPYDAEIDDQMILYDIKVQITAGFKRDIQTHANPSVWNAIKTIESKTNEKWRAIFDAIPDALNW